LEKLQGNWLLAYLAQLAGRAMQTPRDYSVPGPRSSLQKPIGTQAFRQLQTESLQYALLFTIGASYPS
jgi:hypothetical protein